MDADLIHLNEQFAIPGHVSFHAGPGGLSMAVINNAHASATMTLAGGHVMTFTPHGGKPLLWVSPNAHYTIGKAMRGGVPVCWPWFALHPDDPEGKPLHGVARTMLWSVSATRALPGGETEVRMTVRDTPETLAVWPHPFTLEITATFGQRLRLELTARNPGSEPYQYTGALHPYYSVSDVRQAKVHGLEGCEYLDKDDGYRQKRLDGPLGFTDPVDLIFLNTTAPVTITDPGMGRAIRFNKEGSRTTVVWNPERKAAQMGDVGIENYPFFLCAEAANARDDVVTVKPGEEGRLVMEIWAEAQ